MRDKVYPTDRTHDHGALLGPWLPPPKPGGRPRAADLRRVRNTIPDRAKAGRPWAVVPTDRAQRSTAHDDLTRWNAGGTWPAIPDRLRPAIRGSGRPGPRSIPGRSTGPRP